MRWHRNLQDLSANDSNRVRLHHSKLSSPVLTACQLHAKPRKLGEGKARLTEKALNRQLLQPEHPAFAKCRHPPAPLRRFQLVDRKRRAIRFINLAHFKLTACIYKLIQSHYGEVART